MVHYEAEGTRDGNRYQAWRRPNVTKRRKTIAMMMIFNAQSHKLIMAG